MNFFKEATLRLKQQLKVTEDKQVAELLGMSPRAWAGRKRRNSFPEKELYALAAKRPELGLDVHYVLTGQNTQSVAAGMVVNLSSRIREVRGKRSSAAFAKLLSISANELADIEAGRKLPSPEIIMRLVKAHPEEGAMWLMGGDRAKTVEPLNDLESILIQNYRCSSPEGQGALRVMAAFHAQYKK